MAKSPKDIINHPKVQAVGLSWFHETDYAAALAIMTDAVLPPTYAQWLQRASKTERELQMTGRKVFRAIIDPKTFPAWCAQRGFRNIDAQARMAFGAEYAAMQIGH